MPLSCLYCFCRVDVSCFSAPVIIVFLPLYNIGVDYYNVYVRLLVVIGLLFLYSMFTSVAATARRGYARLLQR